MALLSGGQVKLRRPTAISGNATHTPAGGVTGNLSGTRRHAYDIAAHQHAALQNGGVVVVGQPVMKHFK